VIEKKKLEQ